MKTFPFLLLTLPLFAQADDTTGRTFNFELRGTNTCSARVYESFPRYKLTPTGLAPQFGWCDRQNWQLRTEDAFAEQTTGEATTWLRLKGKSQRPRFIGIGYRFQVNRDAEAHFRLRSGGKLTLGYRMTF